MGTSIAAAAAVAAIASAFFVWFQVREMKRQTELQREVAEGAVAPYVWADVRVQTANGWNLEFALGNSGPTVARNVVVSVDPPFPQTNENEGRFVTLMHERLERGLPSLAPGRVYSWTLGSSAELVNRSGQLAHTVTIDCDGTSGPVARSQYVIDFASFRESVARHDGTLRDVAKEINSAADRIVQEQKRQSTALLRLEERHVSPTFGDVGRNVWQRANRRIGELRLAWRASRVRDSTNSAERDHQVFMHVMAPDDQLQRLQGRLARRGFRVGPSQRAAGGLHVRIRSGSNDEEIVLRVVAKAAPEARYGPPGAPTATIKDYRKGC